MSESARLLGTEVDPSVANSSVHTVPIHQLYEELKSCKEGLDTEDAKAARSKNGLNTIPPPLSAPAWLCCLLPCLLHTKAMRDFNEAVPEYAQVIRNKRWLKMDAASLVPGDVIKVCCQHVPTLE
jgi:Cation transporter/ATPase, N-terminus